MPFWQRFVSGEDAMGIAGAVVGGLGEMMLRQVHTLGGVAELTGAAIRRLFKPPLETRATIRELEVIGWQSAGVVGLLGMFIGMVLVVQTGFTMKRLGAEAYTSEGVALAMFRELGPVLAGFLVAGRIGSGIAAEIGSMVISEQIDAMRSLGADPIKKLVLPKVIAAFFGLPILTVVADVIGILGGMVMAALMLNVSPHYFYTRVQDAVNIGDFTSGVAKTAVFGVIIVVVACHHGFRTTGGTVGVGESATRSVVMSCVLILFADLLLTSLFISIGGI